MKTRAELQIELTNECSKAGLEIPGVMELYTAIFSILLFLMKEYNRQHQNIKVKC